MRADCVERARGALPIAGYIFPFLGDNGADRLKEKAVEIAWRGGDGAVTKRSQALSKGGKDFLTCWAAKLAVLKRSERGVKGVWNRSCASFLVVLQAVVSGGPVVGDAPPRLGLFPSCASCADRPHTACPPNTGDTVHVHVHADEDEDGF